MPSPSLSLTIDLLLRGGALFLLTMVGILLLRDHARSAAARLGAYFAIGAVAHVFTPAAGFPLTLGWATAPIVAIATGNNLVFWLFARALFDDLFRPQVWHWVLWLLIAAGSLLCAVLQDATFVDPLSILRHLLAAQTVLFAVLAGAQAVATWRVDLVEPRRRLRLFIVIAAAGYTVATVLAGLFSGPGATPDAGLWRIAPMMAIALVVAWSLLRISDDGGLFPVPQPQATDTPEPEMPDPAAPEPTAPMRPADPADDRLMATLERLMTVDRAYRQEGLTIGGLAGMLQVPEYKLRRLINLRLGHRNFASFLNSYRLADARMALADLAQAAVPILTIALDAGFSSLGPFNRSFKAETGLTPSEFRRQALGAVADSEIGKSISDSASRVSKPA